MRSRTRTAAGGNALESSGLPLFFEIRDFPEWLCPLPVNRHGQLVRVWTRSLTVMQKEAIVHSLRSGKTWRLASDEGPYLQGHDFAPCPLSFFTTGMICSYWNAITALLRRQGVTLHALELVQHNYYGMEGSALAGTMTGSAMPVDLEVLIDCDADDRTLARLLTLAIHASPVDGLMRKVHSSLFTLTHNGVEIPTGKACALAEPSLPLPRLCFEHLSGDVSDPGCIRKLEAVANTSGPGGAGSSLKEAQKRTLHVKASCRVREDGVKVVRQELISPKGSTFRFLSHESGEIGGQSLAPDAVSYVSAGIAFCFMTQLGRYARIVKKDLRSYDVIQDTHFSAGGASTGNSEPGGADPVETHVYLTSNEDPDFARTCLEMGEQTCFLHAFCRTPLATHITITRTG